MENNGKDLQTLGQLFGCEVFINMNSRPFNAQNRIMVLESARLWMERAFKNQDFIDTWKDIMGKKNA